MTTKENPGAGNAGAGSEAKNSNGNTIKQNSASTRTARAAAAAALASGKPNRIYYGFCNFLGGAFCDSFAEEIGWRLDGEPRQGGWVIPCPINATHDIFLFDDFRRGLVVKCKMHRHRDVMAALLRKLMQHETRSV
jgi:hypothetical protein